MTFTLHKKDFRKPSKWQILTVGDLKRAEGLKKLEFELIEARVFDWNDEFNKANMILYKNDFNDLQLWNRLLYAMNLPGKSEKLIARVKIVSEAFRE